MNYQIYQLEFSGDVHLGNGSLDMTSTTVMADTLFSALFLEALGMDDDGAQAESFLERVKNGKLLISDGFPYIDKEWYLPKPVLPIRRHSVR